ncbi:MAG: GtrA family protein [Candidatus Taylorbacteria bacterium]|nr:GtrA family protein [Candidatus Taylorbacteria bacterium]
MIKNLENKFWMILETLMPSLHAFAWKRRRVGKYLISGGTAAATNILFLYYFTDVVGFWYIYSAVLSFSIAFSVSFIFQKFWTFEDGSTENIRGQAILYLVVAVTNLCLNTALIYVLVEFFRTHYLIAQIIAGIIVACESFFVYRRFIFKRT